MQDTNATAGPSKYPIKPRQPFVAAENRPESPDGIFRVIIISSGSVASVKIPEIVGTLSGDPRISIQVVATPASLHFYSQQKVDAAVQAATGASPARTDGMVVDGDGEDTSSNECGVKVWKDEDEWADFKKVGDPILHIELRRWADLVIVAPCSADMLAKVAGGLCDNLATSLLRALGPNTLTFLFPAMNTHMWQHPLTLDHVRIVVERLGYVVSGPQGAGKLACGDEGLGKMTDWRDIVSIVQDAASMFRSSIARSTRSTRPDRPPRQVDPPQADPPHPAALQPAPPHPASLQPRLVKSASPLSAQASDDTGGSAQDATTLPKNTHTQTSFQSKSMPPQLDLNARARPFDAAGVEFVSQPGLPIDSSVVRASGVWESDKMAAMVRDQLDGKTVDMDPVSKWWMESSW